MTAKLHKEILAKAVSEQLPDRVDESSEVSVELVKELVDAGHLKAIDASSMGGTALLEPTITLSGRKYLADLEAQEKSKSAFAKLLKLSSPAAKWAWSVFTAVLIGLVLFWITGQ